MLTKWILLFAFCLPAWGYNLTEDFTNGFYWAALPINIMVVDSDESRKSEIHTLAESAIREWEAKTNLALWDLADGGVSNIIRWSTNFAAETNMDSTSVLAVAVRHTNGPYFAMTEIIINGSHPLNFDRRNLQTTITHELGHTMGLDHSNNMLAVMAPTLQSPYNGLQQDDLKGMKEAHATTENRQLTGYVSPLAYEEQTSSSPLNCGTTGAATSGSQGFLSLAVGMLSAFVRKIFNWFKSRL